MKNNESIELESSNLIELVYSAGNLFSSKEQNWHLSQIKNKETDEEKISFYIWAAKQRIEILKNAPKSKKDQIEASITKLLDQSTGGDREMIKGKPLEDMKAAILQFRENQSVVQDRTRKISHLPAGFEKKVWERFMDRFDNETSGDLLNPTLMTNFRKSIDTTFNHLAKVLEMQSRVQSKLSSEKYFDLRSSEGAQTEGARLSGILQTQIFDWLGQDTRLRDWESGLTDLLKKQLPKNLKEFKEHYSGVFSPEFWKNLSSTNPMEIPNFTVAFNFQSEADFLTKVSMGDIKSLPKALKKSLLSDGEEILSEFFSESDRKKEAGKLKAFSEKKPAAILKKVTSLRSIQNGNRERAQKELNRIKQLYFDKDTMSASAELDLFRKKYGSNVLSSLMEDKFEVRMDLRVMRINDLENQLKITKNSERKKHIHEQLSELCVQRKDHCDLDMSAEERGQRVLAIEKDVRSARDRGDLSGAKSLAKKLRGLNDVKAELLISEINRAIEKKNGANLDDSGEGAVNTSIEKQKKIEFYEKCLEHARGVKEACGQVGIPTDDPGFWKNEGLKNRVGWLKDHGLYHMYQKFNSSDPNIPSQAQNGGFRFRWMDGIGSGLTHGRAETGIKYLQRYKESGYILAALAGAFSMNWKNVGSPTYTPDEFVSEVNQQLSELKGVKVK